MSDAVAGAQSIRRAVQVLRSVAQLQQIGATPARVGKATGLNKTTALRMLRSLCEERMLRITEHGYVVGPLAFELGLAASEDWQVQSAWHPVVDWIARRTRMTTYLVARSGEEAVSLICAQGSGALRAVPIEVGQRVPLGQGSSSLAILASLEDEEIESLLPSLEKKLASTAERLTAAELRNAVALTRRRGFAVGHMLPGITGVGIRVPDAGALQLAISVAAPLGQMSDQEATAIAAIMAEAISRPARPAHEALDQDRRALQGLDTRETVLR